jgi:hypothetical protein
MMAEDSSSPAAESDKVHGARREGNPPLSRLERIAHVGETVGGAAAIVAVLLSAFFFWQGAKADKHATAMGILQDLMQSQVEYPDLAYRDPDSVLDPNDEAYVQFASHAIFVAESLYNLMGDDAAWHQTAADIIDNHVPFVLYPEFPCSEYDPEFLAFVVDEVRPHAEQQQVSVCPDGIEPRPD